MKHLLSLSLLALCSLPATAQTSLTTQQLKEMMTKRTYTETSVHDPSIVIDKTSGSNTFYYVFGSHLGVSRSTNLMSWVSNVGGGETTSCTLFANPSGTKVGYADAYSTQTITKVKNCNGEEVDFPNFDAHGWQYSGNTVQGNQWAPDVIYNPTMGKWLMYMSINGDNWCSSIVCLAADKVTGPWVYQGPVVMSGFSGLFAHNGYSKTDDWKNTDLAIATGETTLPQRYKVSSSANWGNYWPNCIDPCVFYDDDNNLWMSYGSWSGGIFMIRLDKSNGLRDYTYKFPYQVSGKDATPGAYNKNCTSDPYFGKKIAGGYYVSGEGSYIQKIGNYYYLFMSYGGLNPSEGYDMRIFRSANPDGPYSDGNSVSAIYASYQLNYGKNAATNRGMKIIGAFNNWGSMTTGETAQGHNSAMVDDDGDAFVIFHTKFNDGTYGHQVRTRQLFVNENGWLCASAFRYTGKQTTQAQIESSQLFTTDEIAGTYQLLIHPYRLDHSTMQEATPVSVTLKADGTISGTYSGTWKYSQDGKSFVTLKIGTTTYNGVVTKQKVDGYANMSAIAFTAVSKSGVPVWLFKYDDNAAVAKTYNDVNEYLSQTLTGDAPESKYGAQVSYECYEDAAHTVASSTLSSDGTYTYPSESGKRYVVATITCGDYTWTSSYTVNAAKEGEAVVPVYYPESMYQNLTQAFWTNFSKEDYTINAGSSAEFHFYNYSDKANNWDNWILVAATNGTRTGTDYKEYFVLRSDNYGWGDYYNASGLSCDYNWDTYKTDMHEALVDMTVSLDTDGTFNMKSTTTTKANKVYNYSYKNTISTKPSSVTVFFVNEKSYIDGSVLSSINGVKADKKANVYDGRIFNLSGQQVDENYKGIVIINGKKFVRK